MANKEKQFEKLRHAFDTEIREVYDSKLKGSYLIHDKEWNSDGKGISYCSGKKDDEGKNLAEKGASIIFPAIRLYSDSIIDIFPLLKGNDYSEEENEIRRTVLNHFKQGVTRLKEGRTLDYFSYEYVYRGVNCFPEVTTRDYRQGLGEMIFHQLRLVNMCKLGEYDPFHFSSLDRILKDVPDKSFLDGDKLRGLGEGLAMEVLKNKDGLGDLGKARDACKRYDLQNNVLETKIDEMEGLQMAFKSEHGELKRLLTKLDEGYRASRTVLLSEIGDGIHYYDYRN